MPIPTTTASPWPARCAYISAAIFTAASGLTNLNYGWQKGDTLATSLVWAGVAGAVAIVFALSWPALIRSVDARRWSAALISFVALALSGAYSVTAALGSASGGRVNAAAVETATTDARTKAQAAYDAAKAELDALTAAKPATELQALIEGAKAELAKLPAARSVAEVEASLRATQREPQRYGCAMINGSMAMSCPKLDGELARARQRERLTTKIAGWSDEIERADQRRAEQRSRAQADMNAASAELAKLPTAKVANSDAKALARYLAALGADVTAERLNDLLVLLAVLMIEAGGGLSLAVGMALSGPVRAPVAASDVRIRTPLTAAPKPAAARPDAPDTRPVGPVGTRTPDGQPGPDSPVGVVGTLRTVRPAVIAAVRAAESEVLAWLSAAGGTTEGVRRLAEALGRPRSTVSDECRRLAAAGYLTMTRGRRGTVLALVAVGRPN